MIKKNRKNKLAVSIIAVILGLGMIVVFAVNFGIVNFVLWLLQFIVAKPLVVTLKGKAAATVLLTLVVHIFSRK